MIDYDEEKIFWRGYCEIEQSKARSNEFKRKWGDVVGDFFRPFVDQDCSNEERKFREYFVQRTTPIALFILILDIGISVLIFCREPFRKSMGYESTLVDDGSEVAFSSISVSWMAFFSMSLLFFVDLKFNHARMIRIVFDCDMIEAFDGIGKCILISRIMVLVQLFYTLSAQGVDQCVEIHSIPEDRITFTFVAAKICLDMAHICVASLLPMKRTYIALLSLVEAVAQVIRFSTCNYLLRLDPKFFPWLHSLGMTIVAFYVMTVVVPAITLEHSIKASFNHLMDLKDAADEKRQLVNLFCSDLKAPAQQAKHLLAELSLVPLTKAQTETLDKSLLALTAVIDQIVFFIRVHEKRFSKRAAFDDLISLSSLSTDALHTIHVAYGISADIFKVDVVPIDIYSNRHSLNGLLYYSCTLALLSSRWAQKDRKRRQGNSGAKSVPGDNESEEQNSGLIKDEISESDKILLSFRVNQKDGSELAELVGRIVVPASKLCTSQNFEVPGDGIYGSIGNHLAADRYHMQTCIMFCRNIADVCGGTFQVRQVPAIKNGVRLPDQKDLEIGYSIPCMEYFRSLRSQVSEVSWRTAPSSTLPSRSPGASNTVGDCLAVSVIREICVFSPDVTLRQLAVRSLETIIAQHDREHLKVFDRLNMADMQIHSIVIVTGLSECKDLRSRGFTDRIILMTDRLTYLDDYIDSPYDQVIAIPSTPHQLQGLCRWINRTTMTNNAPYLRNSRRRSSITFRRPSTLLETTFDRIRLVPKMNSNENLNYLRWRMVNPSGQIFHHTTSVDVMVTCSAAVLLIAFALEGSYRVTTIVVLLPLYALVGLRRMDVRKIERYGWNVYYIVMVVTFLQLFPCLFQIYILLFNATSETYFLPSPRTHTHDPNEFLDMTFGNTATGKHLVYVVCIFTTTSKFLAEIFMWPYSIIVCIEQAVYAGVVVYLYLSYVLARTYVQFALVMILGVGLYINGVLIYVENLKRTEYSELRTLILSRDALDRCISACSRDSNRPLTALTSMQEMILSSIPQHLMSSSPSFTGKDMEKRVGNSLGNRRGGQMLLADLQDKMEKVNYNILMSKSLQYEMQMSLKSSSPKSPQTLVAKMDSYLLKPIARRICSLFLQTEKGINVQVYLHIHPSLGFVRMNKKMFEIMLFTACRDSMQRIEVAEERLQQKDQSPLVTRAWKASSTFDTPPPPPTSPSSQMNDGFFKSTSSVFDRPIMVAEGQMSNERNPKMKSMSGGQTNEILVCIRPSLDQEHLRFADVRQMQIVVLDTALSDDFQPHSSLRPSLSRHHYLKHTYQRYMSQHGQEDMVFRAFLLNHPHYTMCQQIGFPYKLCPASPKATQFLQSRTGGEDDNFMKQNIDWDEDEADGDGDEGERYDGQGRHIERVVKPQERYRELVQSIINHEKTATSSTPPASAHDKVGSVTSPKASSKSSSSSSLRCQGKSSRASSASNTSSEHLRPLPILTIAPAHSQSQRNATREIVSYADCFDNGWDRQLVYLQPGGFPPPSILRNCHCILMDHQLCDANAESNRHYLRDLLLYLRTMEFRGITALLLPSVDEGNVAPRLCGGNCLVAKCPLAETRSGSDHAIIGSLSLGGIDEVDVELSAPLSLHTLRNLRDLVDNRLVQLSLPLI